MGWLGVALAAAWCTHPGAYLDSAHDRMQASVSLPVRGLIVVYSSWRSYVHMCGVDRCQDASNSLALSGCTHPLSRGSMHPGGTPGSIEHVSIPNPAYPAGLLINLISHAHTFALCAGCQPKAYERGH